MPWPFWAALPRPDAGRPSEPVRRSGQPSNALGDNATSMPAPSEIAAVLRTEQLAAPAAVTAAFAATTRAAVGIIVELNRQITDLEAELADTF